MASEARHVPQWRGLGRVSIHPRSSLQWLLGNPLPHSRVADGRTVVWHAPRWARGRPVAVDAESIDTRLPRHVLARLEGGDSDRLSQWTRLEVLAKLSGTPVLLLLRGSRPQTIVCYRTFQVLDIAVTLGWLRESQRGGDVTDQRATSPAGQSRTTSAGRAGGPVTVAPACTSRMTLAPMPTVASAPISTFSLMTALGAIHESDPILTPPQSTAPAIT